MKRDFVCSFQSALFTFLCPFLLFHAIIYGKGSKARKGLKLKKIILRSCQKPADASNIHFVRRSFSKNCCSWNVAARYKKGQHFWWGIYWFGNTGLVSRGGDSELPHSHGWGCWETQKVRSVRIENDYSVWHREKMRRATWQFLLCFWGRKAS